jgi:hypothetical protein
MVAPAVRDRSRGIDPLQTFLYSSRVFSCPLTAPFDDPP